VAEQIRAEEPVKNTIHNLVQTLSIKLDGSARYSLYQDDARKDGFDDCADAFGAIAERDRQSIDQLLTCLRKHLGEA
jgi:rubrerythrin